MRVGVSWAPAPQCLHMSKNITATKFYTVTPNNQIFLRVEAGDGQVGGTTAQLNGTTIPTNPTGETAIGEKTVLCSAGLSHLLLYPTAMFTGAWQTTTHGTRRCSMPRRDGKQ